METQTPEPGDDDGGGGCTPCMRAGGMLLLGLAGLLAWMGADLVTGGALTRLVTGGLAGAAYAAADVIADGGPAGDNGGQEAMPGDDQA